MAKVASKAKVFPNKRRVEHEEAYVLHSYDWSESSLILETWTKNYGRIALLAKGVKRPLSGFRATLLPLQFLSLSFGFPKDSEAEIATLKAAEWAGGALMPSGANLLSGCYLNELILSLLARDDAHPSLFEAYHCAVQQLSVANEAIATSWLRAFELTLLRETGHLPSLNVDGLTQRAIDKAFQYSLHPQHGLRIANEEEIALSGEEWLNLYSALSDITMLQKTVLAISAASLRIQLRKLLELQAGGKALKTRVFMSQLHNL